MEWLWIIQLVINLCFLLFLFVWWRERPLIGGGSPQSLTQWEDQAQRLQEEVAVLRQQTESQLRSLASLCEQATSILTRHKNRLTHPPSLEEQELKALRHTRFAQDSTRSIPSVEQLEARKQSVRPEIPLDLRSLLRDQLS